MSIRDFFKLVVKLFGLYLLMQTLFYYLPSTLFSQTYGYDHTTLLLTIAMLLLLVGICFGVLKKSDWIIDKLQLDQGFEEDRLDLGLFDEQKLATLAIVFVGGLLLVDYLPSFLNNLFTYFKSNANTKGLDNPFYNSESVSYFDWGITILNLILGYILIIKSKSIAIWITKMASN